MMEIYPFVTVRNIPFLAILPNAITSPSGSENKSVNTKISTVISIPDNSCCIIVSKFIVIPF